MSKISVIIPAYGVEPYLERCLDSLLRQTHRDFEAIVVDDASPDGCGAIAERYAAEDERFVVVHHETNQGLHLARVSGVERATGDYVFFLDGDDELEKSTLSSLARVLDETGADVAHLGMSCVAEAGVSEEERAAMEAYANRPTEFTTGRNVIKDIFAVSHGYKTDWRVTQRGWRASVVKKGFAAMVREPLSRAEDGYECFVLSTFARSSAPLEDCKGYIYHYGIGITGASQISVERFGLSCEQFVACLNVSFNFAEAYGTDAVKESFVGMKYKMMELLANDWLTRVADDDKLAAAQVFAETVGLHEAARELWRFVRDRAYDLYFKGVVPSEDDELYLLIEAAESLGEIEGEDGAAVRARAMKSVAMRHVAELREGKELRAHAEQDVRIFVTTHKSVEVPDAWMLQPVQVGWRGGSRRFVGAFHDDEGTNIAPLNPMYCELTTQYWAWKNARAPYVGFCHYRRYFNFTDTIYEQNPYGEIMDDYIDDAAAKLYGFDDESIRKAVEGYDVITTPIQTIAQMPGGAATPREQYAAAPYLHIADLDSVASITKSLYPDYAEDVDAFLDGTTSCFCNMFVMRWEVFDAYCSWLFSILEAFCAQWDTSNLSKEALRTPGHLAERLFNIYYQHALRTGAGWRTKELQCVHFTNPDRIYALDPASYHDQRVLDRPVVPVVLASDDAYVPMLTTTILSMLENASSDRFYDVAVFERNISAQHRDEMCAFFSRFENASLRFYNVRHLISGHDLVTNNEHISLETYYRFLIQEAFAEYDKVLYLDSDLIIQGDVAELFDTDLEDNLIAGVRDIDFLGNLNMPGGERLAYALETLKLAKPYDYFQAGVLVLNTAELRKLHSVGEWLRIATTVDYLYDDQDILNAECQGRVRYLEPRWNVMHDCAGRVGRIFSFAPALDYDAYLAARNAPKVIHYAGFEKPWTNPDCDYAATYWSYARRTPFYEQLVARIVTATAPAAPPVDIMHLHEKAVSENSPLRRLIDPIAPYGTARREVLKSLGRLVQGKK